MKTLKETVIVCLFMLMVSMNVMAQRETLTFNSIMANFPHGGSVETGIDTVSNTLIDAVKGKGVKTTKVVKEAVKNLTQNATSDAMGKVIDPDSIGGQAVKQIVDDGRGELVSRVFE